MNTPEMLSRQIISLAWIRCLQEEGVNFNNKKTGAVEKDEKLIFEALEKQNGEFDVPKANASRWGMEKNILEVFGSYCLFTDDPYMLSLLFSPQVKTALKNQIAKIKEQSGKKPT